MSELSVVHIDSSLPRYLFRVYVKVVSTWESEDDKRVRRISLTDEAGPVIDQLNRGIREINEIVLSDISEEEIRQMEETMEKIMRNFKAAEEEYL